MNENRIVYGTDYYSRLHAIDLLRNAIKWIESLDNGNIVERIDTNDCDALKLIDIALKNRLS